MMSQLLYSNRHRHRVALNNCLMCGFQNQAPRRTLLRNVTGALYCRGASGGLVEARGWFGCAKGKQAKLAFSCCMIISTCTTRAHRTCCSVWMFSFVDASYKLCSFSCIISDCFVVLFFDVVNFSTLMTYFYFDISMQIFSNGNHKWQYNKRIYGICV